MWGEEWGLASPPHWQSCAVGAHWPPATKSEHRERTGHCGVATLSCTLRILRMLLLVLTGAASPQWITWLRHCGFPSPAGSGAYIHTCGPVSVVGERG